MKTKLLVLRTTLSFLLPLTLLSCNKWLDVKPDSQVKDTELFSTETGFKEALSGVYSSLTYEPLYGRELTFGLMGVLSYEWDYASSNYDSDKTYTYKTNTNSLNRIDAIWNGLYNSVANDNKILEEIDGKKSLFTGDNYSIIKGESLALRAFIHFDLLRTFGASYEENPAKISIPYVTASSKKIFPQLKVSEVLDQVIADLKVAEELLKVDPILTGRAVTTADDNGYLINRQVHLNYYAVKGLLARVYLYKKDYVNALANALVVMQTTKFPWVTQASLANRDIADLTFSTEHLFALNVVRMKLISDNAFTSTGSSTFYITRASLLDYYNSSQQDYRFLFHFTVNNDGNYYLNKYTQLTSANWPASYKNKLPLLKLSEMYFIAAECLKNTNYPQAVTYINAVRNARGLAASSIAEADFETVLAAEYRKEFIAEGQLFFYHKRKNNATIPKAIGLDLVALKAYKLPIPLAEMENGVGRIDNQ
ncbi:MAG: RagB/SusD family nutrient uptake outer membrane protein [Candidatus Pedobacter colombiensis]|uniref:RagB/SusD family nutrient uptake outer membrane protein n=1 Tax=Candidatus Pedobacter colombiensis TaxID=3121371 RepID=A0AAJ5W3L3_9SPHI|nr:RagB/SusD family nutrient uptake outer membrane protein [Pedobacter sp.]WEK17526.1 MAG: RagB/SusD family nutrient uptake outer membrane protein [Pedobacter sp.]